LVDNVTYQNIEDIVGEFEGPTKFVLKKPGQSVGVEYFQYNIFSLKTPGDTCVFVSHSATDREFVEKNIIEPFGKFGIQTWYAPDDIPKGAEWIRSIEEGFRKCQWMVVIVSKAAAESEWVRREIDLAIADPEMDKKIIPILTDDTKPGEISKFLNTKQNIDARDEPRIDELLKNRIVSEASSSEYR
jgi:hypothetical protein